MMSQDRPAARAGPVALGLLARCDRWIPSSVVRIGPAAPRPPLICPPYAVATLPVGREPERWCLQAVRYAAGPPLRAQTISPYHHRDSQSPDSSEQEAAGPRQAGARAAALPDSPNASRRSAAEPLLATTPLVLSPP